MTPHPPLYRSLSDRVFFEATPLEISEGLYVTVIRIFNRESDTEITLEDCTEDERKLYYKSLEELSHLLPVEDTEEEKASLDTHK